MAEHRALAASASTAAIHLPSSLEAGVADGVDTAMNAVQAAGGNAVARSRSIETRNAFNCVDEDDTVLAPGDASDRGIAAAVGEFLSHTGNKSPSRRFRPLHRRCSARRGRLDVLGLDARAHADRVDDRQSDHAARDGVQGGREVGVADALAERDLGDGAAHHRAGARSR